MADSVKSSLDELLKRNVMDISMRIHALRLTLLSIERAVKSPTRHLNELGEIQGEACMLDCRIAGLATLRHLREMEESE